MQLICSSRSNILHSCPLYLEKTRSHPLNNLYCVFQLCLCPDAGRSYSRLAAKHHQESGNLHLCLPHHGLQKILHFGGNSESPPGGNFLCVLHMQCLLHLYSCKLSTPGHSQQYLHVFKPTPGDSLVQDFSAGESNLVQGHVHCFMSVRNPCSNSAQISIHDRT